MDINTKVRKRKEQYTYICLNCNKEYHPKEKNRNKYCSRECAFKHKTELSNLRKARKQLIKTLSNIIPKEYEKVCEQCNKTFITNNNRKKYCSDECVRKIQILKVYEWDLHHYESKIYTCKICSNQFTTGYGDKSRSYCSDECKKEGIRRQRRINEYNREKRLRKAFVAKVIPHEIFKRDNHKCQLCGEKLLMNKNVPHPLAPTIDHIIPLAKGGTHEPKNVQAAHFKCNWNKSDSVIDGGEQLLLL